MKILKEGDFKNKRVLVRCDFNVAVNEAGEITDDFRIVKAVPTIKFLAKKGAIVILMSHLEKKDELMSLKPVAERLSQILGQRVGFVSDCVGENVKNAVEAAKIGQIIMLENLRYHEEEKANDDNFARNLANLGDCYVNEAFSACHRAHASIVGLPKHLPSFAGFLLEAEIANLVRITENPVHPFVVIIGGAKVKTKAKVISNISKIADHVLIGSKIGEEILIEKQQLLGKQAAVIDPAVAEIDLTSPKIHLPVDGVLALKDLSEGYLRNAAIGAMRSEEEIYDIGPETIKFFAEIIKDAKTIFFNGPVGWLEKPEFAAGTKAILEAIARTHGAYRVAGGGETLEAIHKYKMEKNFDFLSTGGGATLEYLSGKELPGIAALG